MELVDFTDGTPLTKPWMKMVFNSVTTDALAANSFTIQNLSVGGNLTVAGNEKVQGYAGSLAENVGSVLFSTANGISAMPAGTGAANITYDSINDQVVVSGLAGINTAAYTNDGGVTWTQPVVPAGNPSAAFSPQLGYYSVIDGGSGNKIYTSPTFATGTFTSRPDFSGNFTGDLEWFPNLGSGKFVASTANVGSTIATSPDGVTYTSIPSSRQVEDFAYSPDLGVFATVGVNGPMYSTDDAKTFINSLQTYDMGAVCWSSYWGMFVATPRTLNLTSIYVSMDGIVWSQITNAFPASIGAMRDIVYVDSMMLFVAVGDNENVWFSQNGILWKRVTVQAPGPYSWYFVRYIDAWGELMIVGNQAFARVTPKRFQPQ